MYLPKVLEKIFENVDGRSNILGLWATSMLNSHREVAPKT